MKKLLVFSFVFLFISFLSCSKDDEQSDSQTKEEIAAQNKCEEAINNATTNGGVACCVLGKLKAAPGDTAEYTYNSSFTNKTYNWTIVSGDITIISGENSKTVKVKFGDNFTGGEIVGLGDNQEGRKCSDSIEVTKN